MGGLFGGGDQHISTTAPVISGIRIQTSGYGLPIPLLWGQNRLASNMLWYGDFEAIPHTTTTSSGGGGKGGGGSVTSSNTTYTYQAAIVLGLCEGPIAGTGMVWSDKDVLSDVGSLGGGTSKGDVGLSVFVGTYPQSTWGYLTTHHPGEAVPYQGVAYVAHGSMQLNDSAGVKNMSFEVAGRLQYGAGIVDAAPHDILTDFLTNANYGIDPGFPLGSMTSYMQYCVSLGIFISPALTNQVQGSEFVTTLMEMTHSAPVWSESLLKIIPYGDTAASGNGQTYTPNVTPIFDLDDDDFIFESGSDPIIVTRTPNADAYNQVKVEYVDRSDQYNTNVTQADDLSNIDLHGLRSKDPYQYSAITTLSVARTVAQLRLQRLLYIRNSYEFKLGWRYVMLEPMDIVTLTDLGLGMDKTPVRITSVEEDEDGLLTFQAEDFPAGVGHAAVYASQAAGGYSANYNISPGNVNPPVIFEAPDTLTVSGLEVFIGASGGALWGGCEVWVSSDDATYSKAGNITTRARTGYLTANLAAGLDPDTVNTLAVDLSESGGSLVSASQANADAFNTLCYVDGELISYAGGTLTAPNQYSVSGYMRRGAYNSPITAHLPGTKFCRIDAALFHYPFTAERIGQSVYIKFLSYNVYGGGRQGLADVQPYQYRLIGSAQSSPLPNVDNMMTRYIDGLTQIAWDAVSDFRSPIDYEVRVGSTWSSAKTLGRVTSPAFAAVGNGSYWVSAHYISTAGVHVYSALPSEIVISGASLVSNVIASYDEAATGWSGTLSGGANLLNNEIILQGAGDILTLADFLAEPDVIWYGGVSPAGEYDLPVGHAVNVGRVAPCVITMNYTGRGQSIFDNALTLTDVLTVTDWFGDALGAMINATMQIALAQADGIYAAWQNFIPGTYNAQYFKARMLLTSSDPQATAVLSGLIFTVDMPDRVEQGSVSVSASGQSILYSPAFNGGANGNPVPLPQITVLNAQQGDDVVLSAQTLSGFTVQVKNGGAGVSRTINYTSQGF